MEALIPVVVVAVIGLIIALVVLSYYQAKKRREDLARVAAGLDLTFDANDPFDIAGRYSNFGLLAAGHNRRAYNVLHGSRQHCSVKAFDYVYHTTETSTDAQGNTTTREVSHYLSAVVYDAGAVFHPLFIRPENFFDKIAAAFGFDDIDFESAEFSRKFYVKSSDKKFAYDVIHPRMMEFLLQHPGWTLQLHGQSLMASTGGLLNPDQFRGAFIFAEGFLKNIPDYLWEQLRGRVRS
jgi:hypothetical protein